MRGLALVLFLLLAAPAGAQWTAPGPISGSADASGPPQLAISRDGRALAAWVRFTSGRPSIVLAPGLGAARTLAADRDWLAGPVAYGRGRAALAYTTVSQRTLDVRLGSTAGSFPRVHRRVTGRRLARPVIAANERGDVAVAWFDDRGTSNDEVQVTVRRAGGRFAAPVRLARGKVRSVSVAVGARGDVLVAWDAFGVISSRTRRAGARGFGATETIRSEEAFSARLQTAVLSNGRAIVAWTAKFSSEGGDGRDAYVQAAVRPAGARRFRRAQLLAHQPGAQGSIRLSARGPLLAWTMDDGVYASGAGSDGVFQRAARVAPEGAQLEDLAGPLVVWSRGGAIHAGDDRLSAGDGARDAAAALDPGDRPVVAWIQDGRVMTATRG